MIWRLTYCNKKGVEARIDIIKGNRTPVEIVEGSGNPFTMSYRLDKSDKSGHIMTSSADIEIFETESFNIDDLKTSNETELKVEYFEENILTWSGFILPDFFSREIGSPNIVRMTASDRLTALKGVTLSNLPTKVSLRSLIELSLAQTGLTLSLASQINISQGETNILDSEILSQRLTDVRGRSISCYDILMSIMVGTNSTIRQRAGQWHVYNKLEHELRTPTIFFDKVERGAIRTIQPVASSVGVYNEFGGSKTYPENYNFKSGGAGWTVNFPEEMSVSFSSKNILGFDVLTSGGGYQPIYGTEENNPHAVIHGFRGPLNYLKSENIPIPSGYTNEVDIKLDINASAPIWNFGSHQRVSVFAVKGERTQVLTSSGFVDISKSSQSEYMYMLQFEAGVVLVGELARVDTNSLPLSGKLSDSEGLDGYSVHIRLYSSDRAYATIINFASINFSPTGDSPKGNLYKTTQGSNFTKQHDIETVIFGDYIRKGLNGYFYDYPIDDTSNLYLPNGELSSPAWITAFDTTERPLLHHISRQKSRLFSVAHDILKANINVESFDPLVIFQDCKGGKYVVVSARFDFLRSEVDVELEQIASDNAILKRDFIYSYFGEGEDTIKSIGGIAGGGGGTGGGGGMTSEQLEMLTNLADWWRLDEENDAIYSEKSVYSLKGVSALGLGSGGGGGGGDVEISITGSGNAVTGVSKSGNTLTFAKGSTFALSTHNHDTLYKPIGYVPSWGEITNKPSTFAPSTHTHTIAQVTDLQSALNAKQNTLIAGTNITISGNTISASGGMSSVTWGDITGKPTTFAPSAHTHSASDITSGALTIARIPTGTTGTTAALGNHLHTGVYEPVFAKNNAFNKNFGTAVGTVAQGNDSRIVNGQTAYGWSNHAAAGYALNSALTAHINKVDNPHAVTTAQIGAVDLTTNQSIGGKKTFNTGIKVSQTSYEDFIVFERGENLWSFGMPTNNLVISNGDITDQSNRLITIGSNGNIRIGDYTVNPLYKLDVTGTGRFTGNVTASAGVNTPKVDFGNGFTIEPSGTELVFKYNGVIKQRMLSNGTILATGGVTALATN